jgi:quinone-modifying oxidoreductase, subunit QmoB
MNDKPRNIVVLSSSHLKGWGIDPDRISKEITSWPNVTETRLVQQLTVDHIGSVDNNSRLFLLGNGSAVPGIIDNGRVYPLNIAACLTWSAGFRENALARFVKAALAEAELQRIPTVIQWKPLNKVLVYGRTIAAAQSVSALHQAGIDVVWAAVNGDVPMPDGREEQVDVLVCRRLKRVDGFAGRFSAVLETEGGDRMEPVAAVWLCGPELRESVWQTSSNQAAPLQEFEHAVMSGRLPDWVEQDGFKLVFLAGVNCATSTANMGRLLTWARQAALTTQAAVYFLAPHVKVAGFGLERLYGEAREAGVAFIRIPMEGPSMETASDGRVTFLTWDPAARAVLRLTPDLVVTEQTLKPAERFSEWSRNTGLFLGPDQFVSPDNVLYLPASTNRRGIFALGAVRGTDSAETLAAEIADALTETRALLAADRLESAPVLVDENRCAHCLSCVRICPAGAIRFTERPWPDPASCVACGLCVSRCPAEALSLAGFSNDQTLARLQNLLDEPGTPTENSFIPRLVVFGCRRSAEPAMTAATPPRSPCDLSFLPLPCGGRLDERSVLNAFLNGADGVIIAACHEDNCRTRDGSPEAARRAGKIKALLDELGVEEGRLMFMTIAPNQGTRFRLQVSVFADFLKTLGPARLRGSR